MPIKFLHLLHQDRKIGTHGFAVQLQAVLPACTPDCAFNDHYILLQVTDMARDFDQMGQGIYLRFLLLMYHMLSLCRSPMKWHRIQTDC